MATLRIDSEVVERLLSVALETVSGVTFVHQGEPEPGESTSAVKWCRIVRVKLRREKRQKVDGETDQAAVVVTVHVAVNAAAVTDNMYALNAAKTAVALVLTEVALADSPRTHEVSLDQDDRDNDPDPDGQRRLHTGAVVVTGVVQRVG